LIWPGESFLRRVPEALRGESRSRSDGGRDVARTAETLSGDQRSARELVVLIVARYWGAQYEWFVHEPAAIKAGLAPEIAAAIRDGLEPAYARDDERVAAALAGELLQTRTVSQAAYDRMLNHFGLELFIELVTVIGFYTTAAMMINTFDSPVPGDARPLPPLKREK